MSITVTVKGLPELAAAANSVATGLEEDTDEAVDDATRTLLKAVRRNTPVRSGRMLLSTRAEFSGGFGRVAVTATRSSMRYPEYPYPLRVEAQEPFFRPAVDSVEKVTLDEMEDKVGDGAERRWAAG